MTESNPLLPGGWPTYVVYALIVAWLLAVTGVMVARLGRLLSTEGEPGRPSNVG